MPYNTQIIFPTSGMGQLSDIYGTGVAPTYITGFPAASGLALGQGGLLFDMTAVNLMKCGSGTAAQYSAMTLLLGFSNFYNLQATNSTSAANQPVIAAYDRGGTIVLSASTQINIAWMTTAGLSTILVNSGVTGNQALTPTTTSGQLQAVSGSNIFSNVILLNTTTTAGGYPVYFQ
jgi:hypothetical protein